MDILGTDYVFDFSKPWGGWVVPETQANPFTQPDTYVDLEKWLVPNLKDPLAGYIDPIKNEAKETYEKGQDFFGGLSDMSKGIGDMTKAAGTIAQLALIVLAWSAFTSAGGVKGITKGLNL